MESPAETVAGSSRLPLTALLVATGVSYLGSQLTALALPWFVLTTTGSAARTGVTGMAAMLPGFAVGLFGGALIDRFGYRSTSIVADIVSGLGIGAIPFLYRIVGLNFATFLALVFVGSLLTVPGLTARRSMLPELATLAGMPLSRVNSLYESLQYLGMLGGPVVASLLVTIFGARNVLWLDAASFAISAALVATAIPRWPAAAARAGGGYLTELRAGLRYIWRDRLLRALAVCLALMNFVETPLFAVVLPVYADRVYGSVVDLGLVYSVIGSGLLVGGIGYGFLGSRPGRLTRRLIWLVSLFATPCIYWVMLTHPPVLVVAAVAFAASLLAGPNNAILVTIRHERAPVALRARIFSTFSAFSLAMIPVGLLAVGQLIAVAGLDRTLLVLALLTEAIAVGALLAPAFKQMDVPEAGSSRDARAD